jgi:hypothetical protein
MRPSLRFLTDEDFDNDILRGLTREVPEVDVVRVQDVSLAEAPDPQILEWAAREGRVLLTHDVSTMQAYAYERINVGLPLPGVFLVQQRSPIGQVIGDLALLAECSLEGEWEGRVCRIPL